MNELKSKFVNVVIAIEEGRGFDGVKGEVYVMSKFCGRLMESDRIDSCPYPLFNTELVWETSKRDLKRVRGDYGSIRVECYLANDDSGKPESIGFTMLLLRSAHLVPVNKSHLTLPHKWEKLRGVPDRYKKFMPALKLLFVVKESYTATESLPPAISEVITDATLLEKEVIPVKFADNGCIQIGESTKGIIPLELKISILSAKNLDALLPKDLVFSASPKKYYFSFTIFGITIQTRSFYRALHNTIVLNETGVICLKSSIDILKIFFSQYTIIPMAFWNDKDQIASFDMDVSQLLDGVTDDNFSSKFMNKIEHIVECWFANADARTLAEESGRPSVMVRTTLQHVDVTCENGQGERFDVPMKLLKPPAQPEKIVSFNGVCDDLNGILQVEDCSLNNETSSNNKPLSRKSSSMIEVMPKIDELNESAGDISSQSQPVLTMPSLTGVKSSHIYRKFCLAVILDSLVWLKQQKTTAHHIQFRNIRSGSKLEFNVTVDEKLNRRHLLDSVQCQMLFISTKDRIQHTLAEYAPLLSILDHAGQPIHDPVKISTDSIVNNAKNHHTYSVKVRSKIRAEYFTELTFIVSLEEMEVRAPVRTTHLLPPQILDDYLSIQQIEELEKWKEEQQVRYNNELQTKIEEELAELRKGWTSRKEKLEEELQKNIQRCKKISKDLKTSANSLEIDKILKKNQETGMDNLNESVQKNYIKYSICENYELIEKISYQERDIHLLKDLLNTAQLRVKELEKTALTGEQTKNLLVELRALEEKYETAQKAKDYFKEQWKKSAIEVHTLKMADNRNVKNHIQSNMDELNLMTMKAYAQDYNNDKNIEWSKALLKNDLFDEKLAEMENLNLSLK